MSVHPFPALAGNVDDRALGHAVATVIRYCRAETGRSLRYLSIGLTEHEGGVVEAAFELCAGEGHPALCGGGFTLTPEELGS